MSRHDGEIYKLKIVLQLSPPTVYRSSACMVEILKSISTSIRMDLHAHVCCQNRIYCMQYHLLLDWKTSKGPETPATQLHPDQKCGHIIVIYQSVHD